MQRIKSGSWRRGLKDSGSSWGRVVPLIGLAGLWLALTIAGCSSDTPTEVGSSLVDTRFDMTLEALGITAIDQYQGKTIADTDIPLASQEVLYLGAQEGNASSILVNFDFSNLDVPAEFFAPENIMSINLRLLMLDYYKSLRAEQDPAGKALAKVYEVFSLSAPFDSTAFPGLIPAYEGNRLSISPEPDPSAYLTLGLRTEDFVAWVDSSQVHGFLIREDTEASLSESGLSGFASREMRHGGSTLDPLNVDIVLGPALLVKLAIPDTVIVIPPLADTSTFHELAEAPQDDPQDGFMLRTCLRSYPIFRFDFGELPQNVFINRAVFYVVNDTSSSFGNLQSIVVSEFDMNSIGVPGESLPLADLGDATYSIIGMNSLDPSNNHILQFNVTSAIQRIVNGVYDGERGLIMTAGEDIFPLYDLSTIDPDFFFTQFNFYGTAAGDTLRPHLRITYSGLDELTGGGK